MTFASAIYHGTVIHKRHKPRRHDLAYRIFYLLVDLDEVEILSKRLRLFSTRRFNLMSVFARDHLSGRDTTLRTQIEAELKRAGIDLHGGRILMLTMPRVLGAAFNPLTVYWCHDRAERLAAMLYEVNNTFGQRHSYLIPVDGTGANDTVRQTCAKRFYVSPFMDMDLTYDFRVTMPRDKVGVVVNARDGEGPMIDTSFTGRRTPMSDMSLLKAFVTHPLLAAKVLAGIHWEALWIWRKGIAIRPRPAPPPEPVTLVVSESERRRGAA